jgi:predicted ATPase
VTVFVGPNNSGKSLVLREIEVACRQGTYGGCQIVDRIEFQQVDSETAKQELDAASSPPRIGETTVSDSAFLEINGSRFQVHIPHYIAARVSPNAKDHRASHYSQFHAAHFTLNLDGKNRMNLLDPQPRGDLKYPIKSFAKLLTDDERRQAFRATIRDAVGLYPGIDMSDGANLNIRFSGSAPIGERTVESSILEWMRNAKSIDAVSDGVKAFSGIILELRAGDPKIILIDEPEAFLHPALAFKLGKELAKTVSSAGKHVFVSTHSPQFLMGAIQSGATVNIVRLTYSEVMGSARILSNDDLTKLMRDPLLRSTNALAGLFYENVIVTEADADRAFYQEINERLLAGGRQRGIPNTLFLNGNGKDTIHRVVAPLRKLGIPAAAVLDIDALNLSGHSWTSHLSACGIPQSQHQPLSTQRSTVWGFLSANGQDPKREGGLALLRGQEREAAENLLGSLAQYGLFILPNGEVEHWLPSIDVPRNKTWLREIFEALGSDPEDASYVRPEAGDVWDFMDSVGSWLVNPNRRGIPVDGT